MGLTDTSWRVSARRGTKANALICLPHSSHVKPHPSLLALPDPPAAFRMIPSETGGLPDFEILGQTVPGLVLVGGVLLGFTLGLKGLLLGALACEPPAPSATQSIHHCPLYSCATYFLIPVLLLDNGHN